MLKFNTIKDAEEHHDKLRKKQEEFDDRLKELEIKQNFKNKKNKLLFPTFTKNLVALIIFVCLMDLQLSYILAFLNKAAVVEELSKSICQTIIGVAMVYMIRAYFDSKAEHNNAVEDELKEKFENFKEEKVDQFVTAVVDRANEIVNTEPDNIPIDGNEFEFNDIMY